MTGITSAKASSDSSLVEAVNIVAKAVTARISYHQREIDSLRKALIPFQDLAKEGNQGNAPQVDSDSVEWLLKFAREQH